MSVHLVGGVFGTLSVGLFATEGGLFLGGGFARTVDPVDRHRVGRRRDVRADLCRVDPLRATLGIRVSPEQERIGLDSSEHGIEAYAAFVTNARE